MFRSRCLTVAAIAVVLLGWNATASAGAGLPPDYQVDLFIGPVFGSSRIIGMGGAYTGLGEGAEGQLYNPAAVAHRFRHSLNWFDYDLGFDWYIFPFANKTDFDNFSKTRFDEFDKTMLFVAPALHFGRGSFGASWVGRFFRYTTEPTGLFRPAVLSPSITSNRLSFSFAWRFLDGRLITGGGIRLATLVLRDPDGGVCRVASASTISPELGVLVLPRSLPVRAGITVRFPAFTEPTDCSGNFVVGGLSSETDFAVPGRVVVPFELAFGVSFQLGERVFNRRWVNPKERLAPLVTSVARDRAERRERFEEELARVPPDRRTELRRLWREEEEPLRTMEDDWIRRARRHLAAHDRSRLRYEPRRYVTISADLHVTGPTNFLANASFDAVPVVGLEAMLLQRDFRSGASWTFSPRIGAESEVLHDRIRVRAGGYLEPPRYSSSTYRPHLTAGGDVRLFYWKPPILLPRFGVRAGFTADVALAFTRGRQYFNLSVSVGMWH